MIGKSLLLFCVILLGGNLDYHLPVRIEDRKSLDHIELTKIGEFGVLRKARPTVPAHYHTGIDIKRPSNNYINEPVFPISEGVVISKRQDGPYAQLIIEHEDGKFWTVYEHIAGIKVGLFDHVSADTPVARFMNKEELNRYGWHFDHIHFEVLKVRPMKLKRENKNPNRLFASYSLVCYTKEDLYKYFYDPIYFFEKYLH